MSDQSWQVQYANQSIQYTTQFLASAGDEEVILDCGSVMVPGGASGPEQLPVHTRMALPWSAVERLHQLLGQLVHSRQEIASSETIRDAAKLPPLTIGPSPSEHAA